LPPIGIPLEYSDTLSPQNQTYKSRTSGNKSNIKFNIIKLQNQRHLHPPVAPFGYTGRSPWRRSSPAGSRSGGRTGGGRGGGGSSANGGEPLAGFPSIMIPELRPDHKNMGKSPPQTTHPLPLRITGILTNILPKISTVVLLNTPNIVPPPKKYPPFSKEKDSKQKREKINYLIMYPVFLTHLCTGGGGHYLGGGVKPSSNLHHKKGKSTNQFPIQTLRKS